MTEQLLPVDIEERLRNPHPLDRSYCRSCGVEICFDGGDWWHDEECDESEPCFDGNRGPEPERLDGLPTFIFDRDTGEEWHHDRRGSRHTFIVNGRVVES